MSAFRALEMYAWGDFFSQAYPLEAKPYNDKKIIAPIMKNQTLLIIIFAKNNCE